METKLKYIQLDNGIELVSEIDISDWKQSEIIRLINPLKLFVLPPYLDSPTQSDVAGEQTMMLLKWIPWVSNSIIIKVDKILVVEDIDQPMVDYYQSTLDKYTRISIEGSDKSDQKIKDVMEDSFGSVEELDDLVDVLKKITMKTKKVLH